MTTLTHHSIPASHFSAKVRKSLLKRGVVLMGLQAVPAFEGDRYFSQTAYVLSDNGMGCVRSFADVLRLAGEEVKWG